VSVGRSASRQRVSTSGYLPRTRNDPPGGGVSRREVAPTSPCPSGACEEEGTADGLAAAEEEDVGDDEPDVEVDPSSGGVAVHAVITARSIPAVARAHALPRRCLESLGIISTTLSGRVENAPGRWSPAAKV
jgi:hypothetical protein